MIMKAALAAMLLVGMQEDVSTIAARAMNAFNNGKYAESVELYTQVLQIDSIFQNARYNRAASYMKLGNMREAIIDLTRILKDAGDVPMVRVQRAVALARIGKYQLGVEDLNVALAKDSTFPKAYFLRAKMRSQMPAPVDSTAICADLHKADMMKDPSASDMIRQFCKH